MLLPGIMGSLLNSIRGVTTSVWINPVIFLEGKANYLEMNRDGTGDADPSVEVAPVGIEKLVYLKIALALHRQTALYEFPYDWRRPVEHNADILHACLERWAEQDASRKFTLVGHSMGGVVSRAYLARHPAAAEQRIKRVVTLGTPHFGAAGAIENVVVGNLMMEMAARLNADNRMKRILLNMPSLYEVLPAPPPLFPAGQDYPANWDIYRATAWQFEGVRQDYLDLGQAFHRLLAAADPQVEVVQIAGCHLSTVVEVCRTVGPDEKLRFEPIRTDAGDGTVPLWSAVLPQGTTYYVQERHRYLPANDRVIAATLELIYDGKPDLPTTLPPARKGLLGHAAQAPADLDAEATRLRERLEQGTADEADLAMLFFAM